MPAYTCAPCFSFTGIVIAYIYSALSILLYRNFGDKFSDIQLNKLTFTIFIFLGVGDLIGGLVMVSIEKKIKDTAKANIILNTVFLLFALIVYLGCVLQNLIIVVIGTLGIGFCDCAIIILTLSIAGNWTEKGITAYTMFQCITVSVVVIFIVLLPTYAILIWTSVFYLASVASLVLYRKKLAKAMTEMQKRSLISEEAERNQ